MPSFFKKSDNKTLDEIKKAVRRKDRNNIEFTYIVLFELIEAIDNSSFDLVKIRELCVRLVILSNQANEITLKKDKPQFIIEQIDRCSDQLVEELTNLSKGGIASLILTYYYDYLSLTKKALGKLGSFEKKAVQKLGIDLHYRELKIQESIDNIYAALNKLQLQQNPTTPTTSF